MFVARCHSKMDQVDEPNRQRANFVKLVRRSVKSWRQIRRDDGKIGVAGLRGGSDF